MSFVIDRFRGPYAFLSNFCHSPFALDGLSYDNVEQFFQSSKTLDVMEAATIRKANAVDARKLGQSCKLRLDWEAVKIDVMLRGLSAKFSQNPDLAALLKETLGTELIEGNLYHDIFWGKCFCYLHNGTGYNWLGNLLMEVRRQLLC